MRNILQKGYESILGIFYPHLCIVCQDRTPSPNESACIGCRQKLGRADIYQSQKNFFTERFSGRLPLQSGSAYYQYRKGSTVKRLIHQLKYHNRKDIGIEIGRMYGWKLSEIEWYQNIDIIIPVPMHPQKRIKRGYNQSDMFAVGLSEAMQIPWFPNALEKKINTKTQTKKSFFERLENMEGVFGVKDKSLLEGKHVLLVDDVLTTGATLEFCGSCISNIPNTKISMATIAISS